MDDFHSLDIHKTESITNSKKKVVQLGKYCVITIYLVIYMYIYNRTYNIYSIV